MNVVYDPADRLPESYSTCEFTYTDGSVITLTPSGSDGLDRANLEYDSPLVQGDFPEQGGFYHYAFSYEGQAVYFTKIFKPSGCNRVLLIGEYGVGQTATCEVTFEDDEVYLCHVLNFSAQSNTTASLELDQHLQNSLQEVDSGFSFLPHELQINGSDFRVNKWDYLHRARGSYVRNYNLAIPDFMNYSLARDGSKYYIGAYARDGVEE